MLPVCHSWFRQLPTRLKIFQCLLLLHPLYFGTAALLVAMLLSYLIFSEFCYSRAKVRTRRPISAHLAYYLSRKRVITKLIDAFSLCSISQCRLFNVARNTSACLSRPSLCSLSIHFPSFRCGSRDCDRPPRTVAPCPHQAWPQTGAMASLRRARRARRARGGGVRLSGMHAPGRTRNDVLSRPAARQTEFADSPRQQQQQQQSSRRSQT